MARQVGIKQIVGLRAELDSLVQTASTQPGTGYPVFDGRVGRDLRIRRVDAQNGLLATLVGSTIVIGADAGTGPNQLVKLDNNGRMPPVDGRNLVNISPSALLQNGSLPLGALTLPFNHIYIGDINGRPLATPPENIPVSMFGTAIANLDIGGYKIKTSAGSWASDELVPRSYVDGVVQGVRWKQSVRVATTQSIDLSAPGTIIDGVSMSLNTRVLVKNQSQQSQNGIYLWKSATAMVRADDADTVDEIRGMAMFIEEGTHADEGWLLITDLPITLGVTALQFTSFTGISEVDVGAGLRKEGKALAINTDGLTTTVYAGMLSVRSHAVAGMPMVSSGVAGTPATWGQIDLTSDTITTGILPFIKGGTGRSTASQHSVFAAVTQGNRMETLAISTYSLLGRLDSNLQSISATQLRELTNTREMVDTASCYPGVMTLITLSQTPLAASRVSVFFNGLRLTFNVDYTITGQVVTATNSLNISYGGSGNDGMGFETTDVVDARYEY